MNGTQATTLGEFRRFRISASSSRWKPAASSGVNSTSGFPFPTPVGRAFTMALGMSCHTMKPSLSHQ